MISANDTLRIEVIETFSLLRISEYFLAFHFESFVSSEFDFLIYQHVYIFSFGVVVVLFAHAFLAIFTVFAETVVAL